jgi:hypothetical protein
VLTTAVFVSVVAVFGVVPVRVIVIGVASGYATVPIVHTIVPPEGAAQLPWVVVAVGFTRDAGYVSVTVTGLAELRPRFCNWIVYVIGDATNTGVGNAVEVSERSASPVTSTNTEVVVALLEEVGSAVVEVTSAQFRIVVPAAVPALTVTTKVKLPLATPLFTFALAVQMTWPVAPTAGAVPQVQPVGGVMEAKTVFGGVC